MIPADIDNHQFTATRLTRGYDHDEVDTFLDRVADHMRERDKVIDLHEREIAQLRTRLAESQRQLDNYQDLPTQQIPMQAMKILEAAQRTADDVISQAERQGRDTVARAEENANAVKYEALARVNDMEAKLTSLQDRRDMLRSLMTEHLTAITEGLTDAD